MLNGVSAYRTAAAGLLQTEHLCNANNANNL
jgi:ornithine cyclodeaminase/alanine dehydrogenase-like protein (mu-crystallin family)